MSFAQNWTTYEEGFGALNGSHYLGNDNIYQLSNIPGVPMSLTVLVRECGDKSQVPLGFFGLLIL